MKDKVIVTMVIGDKYKALWKVTEESMEAYADKVGADLIVLESNPHPNVTPHWAKFALHNILHKMYRRALWLDSDLIIRPDTPDLFDLVPEDKLGVFNEGRFTPRSIALYEAMHAYKVALPTWDRKSYYNTGVMVVSQGQRHLFADPGEVKYQKYSFGEQTFLNLRIFSKEVEVHELSHHFNRMSVMDKITGVSRLASYVVHYAGWETLNPGGDLGALIQDDLRRWGEDGPEYVYRPTLYLHIGGGLGDQVCAEPVVRYIRNVLYPDADIYTVAIYAELFSHIEGINISKVPPTTKVDAVYQVDLHPNKNTGHGKHTLNVLTHPVDYISMEALARVLPVSMKQIKLPAVRDSVFANYHDLILVHPGVGWPSKTFPIEWWQAVIDGLDAAGHRVGVIGRDMFPDKDIQHTYQPVTVPKGGVDFRDRLNTTDLMALLSAAPVLISNDSAPIHIAGAYDNWIILIPTCKHPEHLLPYRHGNQWYKAMALYRSLACEEYRFRPTEVETRSVVHTVRPIEEYLPNPTEVVDAVNHITAGRCVEGQPLTLFPAMKGYDHEYDVVQSH
jgi:hypothetical protein